MVTSTAPATSSSSHRQQLQGPLAGSCGQATGNSVAAARALAAALCLLRLLLLSSSSSSLLLCQQRSSCSLNSLPLLLICISSSLSSLPQLLIAAPLLDDRRPCDLRERGLPGGSLGASL
jgi:hypothetical protein